MKWPFALTLLFAPVIVNAQPNYMVSDGHSAIPNLKNIERVDYTLQCPAGWQIDSTVTELKIRPEQAFDDSLNIYVYSFKTAVAPFKQFIKNPPVDYDAKTTISLNKHLGIYTVTSAQHCTSCKVPIYHVKEQHYSAVNKKVYILYYIATDKSLVKYRKDLAVILNTFMPKN